MKFHFGHCIVVACRVQVELLLVVETRTPMLCFAQLISMWVDRFSWGKDICGGEGFVLA